MIANCGLLIQDSPGLCAVRVSGVWFRGYAVLKKIHGSAIQCTYKHYYNLLSTSIAIYAAITVRVYRWSSWLNREQIIIASETLTFM